MSALKTQFSPFIKIVLALFFKKKKKSEAIIERKKWE
jgi:hypothetical protein